MYVFFFFFYPYDLHFPNFFFCFDIGNGSDVFGSDICTCKPYLTYAMEECIRTAQKGKNEKFKIIIIEQ